MTTVWDDRVRKTTNAVVEGSFILLYCDHIVDNTSGMLRFSEASMISSGVW